MRPLSIDTMFEIRTVLGWRSPRPASLEAGSRRGQAVGGNAVGC